MSGFTSRADLINHATVEGRLESFDFVKSTSNGTLGRWISLWLVGSAPAAGNSPATTPGNVFSSDQSAQEPGAIWFPDRSPDQRHLLTFGAISDLDCSVMLYDRLAGVSGIPMNAVGANTINTQPLTRYASGAAAELNEVWMEYTTVSSTTLANLHINLYTTADGSAGQIGGAFNLPSVSVGPNAMIQMPLSPVLRGVQSVAQITVNTATSGGVTNILIIRPLARIMLPANEWVEFNFLDDYLNLPRIYDDATLGLAVNPLASLNPVIRGTIQCVYG